MDFPKDNQLKKKTNVGWQHPGTKPVASQHHQHSSVANNKGKIRIEQY